MRLEEQFHESFKYFHRMNYNSDRAIRTVYHGTHPDNIAAIIQNNLSMEKKGQLDSGWFGAGMYFSQYADYCMQYHTTGKFERVKAGDSGKLLQFDILPGRMHQLEEVKMGGEREMNFDSHCSPNEFEYVMFDPRHVLPRYVISFEVMLGAGAKFNGSIEQTGGK